MGRHSLSTVLLSEFKQCSSARRSAERRSAECRCAECRGANFPSSLSAQLRVELPKNILILVVQLSETK